MTQRVIGGGGQNNAVPQTQNQTASNGNQSDNQNAIKNQDSFRIIFSAIAAVIVYFFILIWIPDSAEPWKRHLCTFGLSVLLFVFIGFAQKKVGKLGDAIVTFLFLIFCFEMAINYL